MTKYRSTGIIIGALWAMAIVSIVLIISPML